MEFEEEFKTYLENDGGLNNDSKSSYISRLRFLSGYYNINNQLNDEAIGEIIGKEEEKIGFRQKYNTSKNLSDFKSALRKYMDFLFWEKIARQENKKLLENLSDNQQIENEIEKINSDSSIPKTEKESLILSRIGQGKFRKDVITFWQKCALSGCDYSNILIASHIKSWKDSNNYERLDKFNGLLLLPNYDKLFDGGYISFDDAGKIIISEILSETPKTIMAINTDCKLFKIEKKHKEYLAYHREKWKLG